MAAEGADSKNQTERNFLIRPTRVEVSSPLRLDLGMAGISDISPYTNQKPGRAVSLCINLKGSWGIRCVGEVTSEDGLTVKSVDKDALEKISSWTELKNMTTQLAIMHAALLEIFPKNCPATLTDFLSSSVGGGIHLQLKASTPKGMGSSSIIISTIIQAATKLLGIELTWREIISRTISAEADLGVGGGWEDALPTFFGGAILADSDPGKVPKIRATRLDLPQKTISDLQNRLVLFDPLLGGKTDKVIAQAKARSLQKEADVVASCDNLRGVCQEVADALSTGDLAKLGQLLSEQWHLWKIITGNACTTPEIEEILEQTKPFVEGTKVSGAGSGGAFIFIVNSAKKDELIRALQGIKGVVLPWEVSFEGYKVNQWFDKEKTANYVIKHLPNAILRNNIWDRQGKIEKIDIKKSNPTTTHTNLRVTLTPVNFQQSPT